MQVIAVSIRRRIIHLYDSGKKTQEIAKALATAKQRCDGFVSICVSVERLSRGPICVAARVD